MIRDEQLDKIEKAFKEYLEMASCYKSTDDTYVNRSGDSILLGYNVNNKKDPVAEFSLQFDGPICYILSIEVRKDSRRKGVGRELFRGIQRLCLRCLCTEIQTTPSGMGKAFWPAMGFVPFGSVGSIKKLYPIKSKEEHEEALAHIEILMGAHDIDPRFEHLFKIFFKTEKQVEDKLEQLVESVSAYEDEHYPIGKPTPEEAAKFRKEQEANK